MCFAVQWAFGTCQKIDRLLAGDFLITTIGRTRDKLGGLSYQTKFSFPQPLLLLYNEAWFK